MAWTRNAWNNFKARPEIWFFYGFILTSPLSIRKVVFDYSSLGAFNEYSGVYVYLSDIFLALTIGVWVISILYNKLQITSTYSPANDSSLPGEPRLFHPNTNVPRGTKYAILCLPAILVLWSFITVLWSEKAEIAAYRSFKLFEFCLLYLFLAFNYGISQLGKLFHPNTNVPPQKGCSTWNILRGRRGTSYGADVEHVKKQELNFIRNTVGLIIIIGLINAIIGILQVTLQSSLGLFWLRESLISPDLPGVAKIILGGTKYMRAYGLFPHPNILGGFLFLSIFLTLEYRRLFHPSANVPRGTFYGAGVEQSPPNCATECIEWKNGLCKIYSTPKSFLSERICSTWNKSSTTIRSIFTFILGIQIVAGILTFSKSAILALIIGLIYLHWHRLIKMFRPYTNVPRGTSYGSGVKQPTLLRSKAAKNAFLAAIFIGLVSYLGHPDLNSLFIKSMAERLVYIGISLKIISGNFLAGIGSGQFVLEMQDYSHQVLQAWQFQPVHNVFLLIWSELGLIGLSIFTWFIVKLFHPSTNVPRGTFGSEIDMATIFKALLIGFFTIALFDHYLWDIQQGQIMLWITLGLLAGTKFIKPIY